MIRVLSESDKGLVKQYREEYGILTDVQPHLIQPNIFTGLICCSDFTKRHDIFAKHEQFQLEACGNKNIHPLLWHGGALVIPESSPLALPWNPQLQTRKDLSALDEIWLAYKELGMRFLTGYIHAPCGAAQKAGLTFADEMRLLIEAKDRIKAMFPPDLKVSCYCHVDKGDGDQEDLKRTYFVLPKKWREQFGFSGQYSFAGVGI